MIPHLSIAHFLNNLPFKLTIWANCSVLRSPVTKKLLVTERWIKHQKYTRVINNANLALTLPLNVSLNLQFKVVGYALIFLLIKWLVSYDGFLAIPSSGNTTMFRWVNVRPPMFRANNQCKKRKISLLLFMNSLHRKLLVLSSW